MSDRDTIDLDRSRGDFIDVPKGPLDRPRNLHWQMAVYAVVAACGVYLCWQAGVGVMATLMLIPAVLFGVSLAGRFPAFFFRRDRT